MNGIIQHLSFRDCLISLSILSSRFIHPCRVACARIPSFLRLNDYSVKCICHILFTHLSMDTYLGGFCFLTIVKNDELPPEDCVLKSFGYIPTQEWNC